MAERLLPGVSAGATRPRRRLSAHERRVVILGAAEEVFARCGYHRASLDEIARAAGVSKALIYEHFKSKRELHASLLDAHATAIFARLERGAAQGTTSEERLRGGIDAFLAYVEEHREAWRALFRDASEPDAAELVHRMQRQATAVVAALIAADTEASSTAGPGAAERELGVTMHAQLLSGAVGSLASWWQEHPDVPRAVLVDRAMAVGWTGVAGLREGVAGGVRPDER
jgi:AcrR family transcriptional regulator